MISPIEIISISAVNMMKGIAAVRSRRAESNLKRAAGGAGSFTGVDKPWPRTASRGKAFPTPQETPCPPDRRRSAGRCAAAAPMDQAPLAGTPRRARAPYRTCRRTSLRARPARARGNAPGPAFRIQALCRSCQTFLQQIGDIELGRPAAKIAEVRAPGKRRAHVAELQLRSRRPGPCELGEYQVLARRDPGVESGETHAGAPLEFVAPERLVLAHDEIELHQLLEMKDVEHAALAQRALHVDLRDVVLRLEERGKPFRIPSRKFNHEIDVARHARLGVVAQGERAGEHVRDPFALEPSERVLQHFKLGAHEAQSCVALGATAQTSPLSPRLLPLRLEHGASSRRGEELDQRLCRRWVLRAHADAGMEDGVVLQFGGQGPQDFDAGGGHQFVDEDDAELDFPRRDEISDFDARGGRDDFRSHLFGDADALEKAREVDAALAFFRPGNGVRGEERAPERPLGADIRTPRALPDSDSHARARDRGAAARVHFALLREVVEPGGGEYGEVEGFARLDLALQGGGEAEGDDELVSGCALEDGRELEERLLHAVRGEDLDFGGGDGSRG